MDSRGNRLTSFRMALPRQRNGTFPARSLSVCLGWAEGRWRELEKLSAWTPDQQQQAERGVTELLRRLSVSEEQSSAWVAYVCRESEVLPALDARWRDGLCPLAPVGRPVGSRMGPDGRMVMPQAAPVAIEPGALAAYAEAALRTLDDIIDAVKAGMSKETAKRLARSALRGSAAAAGLMIATHEFWDTFGGLA